VHFPCPSESALLLTSAFCYGSARLGPIRLAPGSILSLQGRDRDTEDLPMRKEALSLLLALCGAIAWLVAFPVATGAG
jgi:hypothetical protein